MSLSIDQINELQAENKRLKEALRRLRHYTSYGSVGRGILEAVLDPRRELMATESEQVRMLRENELLKDEIESLKADVEQQAQNWTLLFSDYEQEQARRKRLEEVIKSLLGQLDGAYTLFGSKEHYELKALLAEARAALPEGDADADPD